MIIKSSTEGGMIIKSSTNDINHINKDGYIKDIITYYKNRLSEKIDKAFGICDKKILITKKHVNSLDYDFIINGLSSKNNISDFTNKNDIINNTHNKSINFVDKILWINLEKSIDRNNYMSALLKNVPIPNIRIDAINGNMINIMDTIGATGNTTISNSEIGCTLSHIKAINYLKDVEGEYFLICEDDISLVNINLIPRTLEEIITNAPDFDILLIHKIYCKQLSKIYTNWNKEYNKDNNNYAICSTASYVISRSGINKICNEVCSYDSIENKFKFYKQISVADIFIYNYTNTWVYKYNFISTKDEDSIIHTSHLEYHKKSSKMQLDIIKNDFGFYEIEK